jgi:hypothetical protein
VIDESRRALHHSPAETTRAEPSTGARQADESLEGARRAKLAHESKLQASARQETLELASHEHRQWAVGGLDLVDEAAEVLVEHTVENRLGRPTSAIGG